MAEQDTDQKVADQKNAEQNDSGITTDENGVKRYESGDIAEAPEPTDEHREQAKKMAESYVEKRPTTVLPGSDATISGTAVNDWIDDEGNPVHGEVHDNLKEAAERDRERNRKAQQPDAEDKDSKQNDG